ncbi:hypothetical protein [Thermobacillus sp. ZCTH02-B1]|uniref:hypothetical protein n=1 Tax=Thermobacillus sp. ZCTH02-B1 TaxID=1858795 RepID=UPI0025F861CC|nr:hypothetical protein [Thermobacillus sp. ZCTH02-B1]
MRITDRTCVCFIIIPERLFGYQDPVPDLFSAEKIESGRHWAALRSMFLRSSQPEIGRYRENDAEEKSDHAGRTGQECGSNGAADHSSGLFRFGGRGMDQIRRGIRSNEAAVFWVK